MPHSVDLLDNRFL